MIFERDDFTKQQNVKILKRLVILLILSGLMIGSGLAAGILGYEQPNITDWMENLPKPILAGVLITGLWIAVILVEGFLFLILLGAAFVMAVNVAVSAVLALITNLQIRRDSPDKQRKGKQIALAALILNSVAAVGLLLLNLFCFLLEFIPFYPWGLLSISLCLTGAALLIPCITAYRKLQILPEEDSERIPADWKDWNKAGSN